MIHLGIPVELWFLSWLNCAQERLFRGVRLSSFRTHSRCNVKRVSPVSSTIGEYPKQCKRHSRIRDPRSLCGVSSCMAIQVVPPYDKVITPAPHWSSCCVVNQIYSISSVIKANPTFNINKCTLRIPILRKLLLHIMITVWAHQCKHRIRIRCLHQSRQLILNS